MNIKDFLLVLFFFCIGIFVFMLFFIPPVEWKSIVEYFLVTSPWEWIGQIGFLVMAALGCAASYFFLKGVLTT